jgi:simple sugar transport system ATP-binding protein
MGVVLVSENLDEVFALSDRILVLSDGAIVAETTPEAADRRTVGLWMGGADGTSPAGRRSSPEPPGERGTGDRP